MAWGRISGLLAVIGLVLIVAGALIKFDPVLWLGIITVVAGAAAYRFMDV